MNHKFTSDGRKVVIIGALNTKETIVQEIFVTDGTEFPAGEHFVVKTLLDAPAETYQSKKARDIEATIKRLEGDRDKLVAQIKGLQHSSLAAFAKIKWIEGIKEPEVKEVFGNIKSILCGEYTHVIIISYSSLEIKEWDADLFTATDNCRFDGLRLISLYGEWNGRLAMGWRVNTYRDGSGSWTNFVPCKSLTEAIGKVEGIINAKETLSDNDFKVCLKYGIPVDEVKNRERLLKKREYTEKRILETKKKLEEQEADLEAIR